MRRRKSKEIGYMTSMARERREEEQRDTGDRERRVYHAETKRVTGTMASTGSSDLMNNGIVWQATGYSWCFTSKMLVRDRFAS